MVAVRLVHWNAGEAAERAERLAALGYQVVHALPRGTAFFRELAEDPPGALVVDLSRLPAQGRDLAVTLRTRAGTRGVPLVFVEGAPEKVARVRDLLPDAAYTTWDELGPALAQAIAHPPEEPVDPGSAFAAYARTPLVQKLGIQADAVVALVDAPEGMAGTLADLPSGVEIRHVTAAGAAPGAVSGGVPDPHPEPVGVPDLTLWFVRSRAALEAGLPAVIDAIGEKPAWIAWPKKASGVASDLSQTVVRETGLAAGLVDYKICSIDETWSALLFTRRQ